MPLPLHSYPLVLFAAICSRQRVRVATAASLVSLPRRRQVRPPRRGSGEAPPDTSRRALSCGFSPRPAARTRPLPGADPASLPGPPLGRVSHARRWCGGSKQRAGQGPVAWRGGRSSGRVQGGRRGLVRGWNSQLEPPIFGKRRRRRDPMRRLFSCRA